jgi:AcrR family transcriptional regulator
MAVDGLRERKRAATQAAIERAAINLALEHGYDNVTVDMICESTMVSQRTFFNYFGSKEGVILGVIPPLPSGQQIDAFVQTTGTDVLGDFLALVMAWISAQEPDADLMMARRKVIMHTPELLSKQTARMAEFEEQLVAIVLTRYKDQGRTFAADPDLEDEARMVVSLSTGVMRYVMRQRFSTVPAASTQELLRKSIRLIHRITNDTSQPQKGMAVQP